MELKHGRRYNTLEYGVVTIYEKDGGYYSPDATYIQWEKCGTAYNGYDRRTEFDIVSEATETIAQQFERYTEGALFEIEEIQVTQYIYKGYVFEDRNALIRYAVLERLITETPTENLDDALVNYAQNIEYCYQ